jgi:hypothetical protein
MSNDTADPQRDFDFLFGRWRVSNRRLKERLKGSTDWEEFETTSVAWPVWGGAANMDVVEGTTPSGPLRGMTLRLFDPRSRQWRVYWANATTSILEQPMIGGFRDGRGEFYDQELFEGRAVFVRYVWSEISARSCRWEQAFSDDGGTSWETNWTMEFTRTAGPEV